MDADILWTFQQDLTKEGVSLSSLPPLSLLEKARNDIQKEKDSKAPKKKSKWATSLDNTFELNFATAKPLDDISKIDWSQVEILGVQRSEGGSEGLFFVETKNGTLIVKRSTNISSELTCSLLAMRLGIHCPKIQIIKTDTELGEKLLLSLHQKEPSGRVRSTLANQAYILTMEFVRGLTLNTVDHRVAQELMDTSTLLGQQTLKGIGALTALDVLSNNCDRLPLIWANQGNEGNVMFAENAGTVISIDAKIIPIHPEKTKDLFVNYSLRVQNLLEALVSNPDKECSQFRSVRDAITACIGHDVGPEGSVMMQQGFMEIVKKCSTLNLVDDLKKWNETLEKLGMPDVNPVNVVFVSEILDIFKLAEKPDELKEVIQKTETLLNEQKPKKSPEIKPAVPSAQVDSKKHDANEHSWSRFVIPNEKPSPRMYASSVFSSKNTMFVFGGFAEFKKKVVYNDLYALDIEKQKWALVSSSKSPSARYGHTAVVHKDIMFIFGGADADDNSFGDFWSFNFETNEWREIEQQENTPSPRFFHSCTVNHDKLYVFGGSTSPSSQLNDLYCFSLVDQKWSKIEGKGEDLPSPRAGHISFVHEKKLYIFGGFSGEGYSIECDMSALDLDSLDWEEVDTFGSLPRCKRPLTAIYKDKPTPCVYVYGGYDGVRPLNLLLVFFIKDLQWKQEKVWQEFQEGVRSKEWSETTPPARYGHSFAFSALLHHFYLFGGCDEEGCTNEIIQIDLES